jgi:hypothetical protein
MFSNLTSLDIQNSLKFSLNERLLKWRFIDENDIIVFMLNIITNFEMEYIGNEFELTGDSFESFNDIAGLLSEEIGEKINFIKINDNFYKTFDELSNFYSKDELLCVSNVKK